MALKQLMLRKKLDQKNSSINELMERENALKLRSQAAEQALEEAQTDEEVAAIEEEANAIDAEQAQLDQERSSLQEEINALQIELEQLNSKEPDNQQRSSQRDHQTYQNGRNGQGGDIRMTTIFRSMTFEQRNALVARSEVKEFLGQVRELRAQQRSVTGAELTIPDILLGLIRDNLHRYSKLISKVNKRTLKGTARQNISGAIPEGIWTEACASLNELAIIFNQIEVDGYKVGGFIPICNATLEDSDENLAAEILEAISQAIGIAVDKAILFGTGKKMLLGIATRLAQTSQPADWGTKAPTWTALNTSNILKINPASMTAEEFFAELILKLNKARANYSNGEKFWAMNSNTYAALQAKAIVFNAAGALVSSVNQTMPVIGGDVVILEFMNDNDIIGGYGSLYLLVERAGIQLAQSEHVRFIEDQTVFKGTARYDGKPVFGEGFVMVNIANANPTTTATFAPDIANPSDAHLSALTIGSLSLSPSFDGSVFNYTAATTAATNTITATAAKDGAVVSIKNGNTDVANGEAATWASGSNTVTITVTYGTTVKTYTVVVTKS